jgi:hypothetical protein
MFAFSRRTPSPQRGRRAVRPAGPQPCFPTGGPNPNRATTALTVSGAGTGGVFIGGLITAGALNARTMSIGSTVVGVTTASGATGQISILGSPGVDTLFGSTVADAISGGAGNDVIDAFAGGDVWAGGAGADTFGNFSIFAFQGQGVAATASTLTGTIAAGQTLTFGAGAIGTSNIDRVTDFVSGTDKMDVITGGVAPTNLFGGSGTAAGTAGVTYLLYGNYAAATGVFTVAAGFSAATADAIVNQSDGAATPAGTSGWAVLVGLNQALVAADFV